LREVRLKSSLWIEAYRRQCEEQGAYVTIARKGDGDAGVVIIKILTRLGEACVVQQTLDIDGQMVWGNMRPDLSNEVEIDQWLSRQVNMDPDIWIVEVEGCDGKGFLNIKDELSG